MERKEYHAGLDVSKGTTELCLKNSDGAILHEGTFDDTPVGHAALKAIISEKVSISESPFLRICMESTGGFERNWYRTFRHFSKESENIESRILNPMLIHGFTREKLHKSTTDTSAARDIAEYSRLGRPMPELTPDEMLLDGTITLYRTIGNAVDRLAKMKNEFHSMLPTIQPHLCQYCQNDIPNWVLLFLQDYPTVDKLKRIRVKTISNIRGITMSRAQELVDSAKESIAAYRDDMAGYAIQHLAVEILRLNENINDLKKVLSSKVSNESLINRLTTIIGVGSWTAIGLITEIGDIRRFPRPEELIAYAGLDPTYHQSGDGIVNSKISRRGKSSIRKLLFMAAKTAAMHNPVIEKFYERLKARGFTYKKAITACMGKLLRIVFAVWVSKKDFDPDYEQKKCKTIASNSSEAKSIPGKKNIADPAWDKSAPISWREKRRRKEVLAKIDSQPCSNTKSMLQQTEAESLSKDKLKKLSSNSKTNIMNG